MDTAWGNRSIKGSQIIDAQHPSDETTSRYVTVIRTETKTLSGNFHDGQARLNRAKALNELELPELAVHDAWYCVQLAVYGLGMSSIPDQSDIGSKVKNVVASQIVTSASPKDVNEQMIHKFMEMLHRDSLLTLFQSLQRLNCVHDLIEIGTQILTTYPTETRLKAPVARYIEIRNFIRDNYGPEDNGARFAKQQKGAEHYALRGMRRAVEYPWLESSSQPRTKTFLKKMRSLVYPSQNGLRIADSTVAVPGISSCGVYTNQAIPQGTTYFEGRTPYGVSSLAMGVGCYNCGLQLQDNVVYFPCCEKTTYCSEACKQLARDYYHDAICGRDFAWIYERPTVPGLLERLWLRVLAIIVQSKKKPLENHLVKLMAPKYPSITMTFYLSRDIETPMRILHELGVDPYNVEWDNWVLQIILTRIHLNRLNLGPDYMVVDPAYFLINHACKPNSTLVDISQKSDLCTTTKIEAVRDIAKDEELSVSYVDGMMLDDTGRRERLSMWFGDSGCKCDSCLG